MRCINCQPNKTGCHEMPLSSSSVALQTVMLTHPEFWCQCPDWEQTASLFSVHGQIKIPTLNYSEHSLQAVWVPKWFASLTHYCSSQAFLKKCTWRVFRWCLQPGLAYNLCSAVKTGTVCLYSY